jgi:hypothetical protein
MPHKDDEDKPLDWAEYLWKWRKFLVGDMMNEEGTRAASAAHVKAPTTRDPKTLDESYLSGVGFEFADVEAVAHGYGAGPVTVYAKADGVANKAQALVNTAKAVRAWNQATGIAVFTLVSTPDLADIVVNMSDEADPLNPDVAGTGTPLPAPDLSGTTGVVNVFGDGTNPQVLAHEFGHTLGLSHPGPPGFEYEDPNSIMGNGPGVSYKEAALVSRLRDPTFTGGPGALAQARQAGRSAPVVSQEAATAKAEQIKRRRRQGLTGDRQGPGGGGRT